MELVWRISRVAGAQTKANVSTRQTNKSPPWSCGAHGIIIKVYVYMDGHYCLMLCCCVATHPPITLVSVFGLLCVV